MLSNSNVKVQNLVVETKHGDKCVEYKENLIENKVAGVSLADDADYEN